MSIKIYI